MSITVEEQYARWVYPAPVEDMRVAISNGTYIEIGDPLLYWPLMWPHKRSVERLDILVAGCGTNQAAYYACRNPNWNVIGIDLSDTSLAHQNKLKEKHNLTNLRLEKRDLTTIESLSLDFDFITSTGVLHHLPNPDEGLMALKNVLRPEGVMNLMVYGTNLRLGVYLMQEVFRTLGFTQNKADVDIVRTTIDTLDDAHVVKRYVKVATDLGYDAGMVDTFLHPQDRSYTVKELFEFTRNAGLEFLSWLDPLEYSLEHSVPKSHPLWKKIHQARLPQEVLYHINDLLVQNRGTHRWLCAHPEYVKRYRIDFTNEGYLDYQLSLHRATKVVQPSDISNKTSAKLQRESYNFEMSFELTQLMKKMEGKTSIRQALEGLNLRAESKGQLIEALRKEIQSLYERGHVYVFLPEGK